MKRTHAPFISVMNSSTDGTEFTTVLVNNLWF